MERLKPFVYDINGRWHELALWIFMAGILAHMAEHVVQAMQLWVFSQPLADSRGVVGQWIPALATSESLHYFYAIYTLLGLVLLYPAFQGQARFWWSVALLFQFWHHFEHVILLFQRVTGDLFFGQAVPTSIVQVWVPRVELHLFYNSIVFVPMMIALWLHFFPPAHDELQPTCGCPKREAERVQASASLS